MKTSDVKTEVITTKNYEIQYWMTEEYREEGEKDTWVGTYENKEEAIDRARKLYESGIDSALGSVEVVSDDENEGSYGVVYHFSEDKVGGYSRPKEVTR